MDPLLVLLPHVSVSPGRIVGLRHCWTSARVGTDVIRFSIPWSDRRVEAACAGWTGTES